MPRRRDLVRGLHRSVQSSGVWTADEDVWRQREHWYCWADEVLRGEGFRDDCDGFAWTWAELALRSGVPRGEVGTYLVRTQRAPIGHAYDHMVCVVWDDGHFWVLDNQERRPVWSYESYHRPYAYHDFTMPVGRFATTNMWRLSDVGAYRG